MESSFFTINVVPDPGKNEEQPIRRIFPLASTQAPYDPNTPLSSAEPYSIGPCKRIHVRTRWVTVTPVRTVAHLPPAEAPVLGASNVLQSQKRPSLPSLPCRKVRSQVRLRPAASLELERDPPSPGLPEASVAAGLYQQTMTKTCYHERTLSDTTYSAMKLQGPQTIKNSRSLSISKLTGTTKQGSLTKARSSQKPLKKTSMSKKWTWVGTAGPVKH